VGDGDGSDPAGLGASDHATHATARLEAHFGNLGALAATGFSRYDDHWIILDGLYDLLGSRADGQLFGK